MGAYKHTPKDITGEEEARNAKFKDITGEEEAVLNEKVNSVGEK